MRSTCAFLFLACMLSPSVAADWLAEDAAADAQIPGANQWADIRSGDLSSRAGAVSLNLTLMDLQVPPVATIYMAIYGSAQSVHYCGMVQDRPGFLKFFGGEWDESKRAPVNAVEETGEFLPGAPAVVRAQCDGPSPTWVRFETVDIKPYLVGAADMDLDNGILLDEAEATEQEQPRDQTQPEPEAATQTRPAPGMAAPTVAVALALIAGRRRAKA